MSITLMLFVATIGAQTWASQQQNVVGTTPSTAVPDVYDGWDCSPLGTARYCTRTLTQGDTGWNFSKALFNDPMLWHRFQEDNPDATRVFEKNGKTILQWKAGTTIRIRNEDLKSIQKGTASVPAQPADVGVEMVVSEYPWWLLPAAMVLLGLLGLVLLPLLFGWYQRQRQRPGFMGPSQSRRGIGWLINGWLLNLEPDKTVTRQAFTERIMPNRQWHQIYRVTVSGIFPTRYGDNVDRVATARDEVMYVGVLLDAENNVTEARMAWASCLNETAQLTPENAATIINSNPTFSNATILINKNERPNVWQKVERYLRAAFTIAREGQADTVQNTAAAASETPMRTELEKTGFRIYGRIELANGAFVDTGSEGARVVGSHTVEIGGTILEMKPDQELAFSPKKTVSEPSSN